MTQATISAEDANEEIETLDLGTWSVVQYELQSQPDANWVLESGNTVARQTVNADASSLLSDTQFSNDRIDGTWRVATSGDDDYMGFVFGYQDDQHYYLFEWKRGNQNDPLGFAERGMSVKVVNADSPLTGFDFWPSAGNGDRVESLFHNTIPWQDNTEYGFTLEFQAGEFTITVSQGETVLETISIVDDTYTTGGFGFYNYSQGSVLYSGFTREALAAPTYVYDVEAFDPDFDKVEYRLIESVRDGVTTEVPRGMRINVATGLITWGPTADQVGNHAVTVEVNDGNGGVAIQEFVVCVHDANEELSIIEDHDLQVSEIDVSGLTYDGQLLTVAGEISATVTNNGADEVFEPFHVTFFEDSNRNELYDPGVDRVLGHESITESVAGSGQRTVTTTLSGNVAFAHNVIWAIVDSEDVVSETNEENNINRAICEFVPTVGQFNPAVEWNKSSFSVRSNSNQVMMAPIVADLNQDGIPDIIFSTFSGSNYQTNGVLRAISGLDGTELWTLNDARYEVSGESSIALGDIDLDGLPEIVAVQESDVLMAVEHDGTFKWFAPNNAGPINWGGASLADLDGDGVPEIIVGSTAFNADGSTGSKGISPIFS